MTVLKAVERSATGLVSRGIGAHAAPGFEQASRIAAGSADTATTFVRAGDDSELGLRAFGAAAGDTTAPPKGIVRRLWNVGKAKGNEGARELEKRNAAELARNALEGVEREQQKIKNSITTVGAAVKKIEAAHEARVSEMARAQRSAATALEMGNREAFALAFPRVKELELVTTNLAEKLESAKGKLKNLNAKFQENERQLETFRLQLDVDIADNQAATAMASVAESAAGVSSSSQNLAYYTGVLRDSTADAYARAGAIDTAIEEGTINSVLGATAEERLLRRQWSDSDSINQIFDQLSTSKSAPEADTTAGAAKLKDLDDVTAGIDELTAGIEI